MWRLLAVFVILGLFGPVYAKAAAVGYSITVTTAYAAGDPFPNRIDQSFVEPMTGYFQIENTGDTTFSGIIGTIAVSSFAGDLSFTSGSTSLIPGASVSVAIPDNSEDVGGFNGPFYDFRPGVEITLERHNVRRPSKRGCRLAGGGRRHSLRRSARSTRTA